jgi:hypothetical protein
MVLLSRKSSEFPSTFFYPKESSKEKRPNTSGNGFGFTLTINGTPILQWFKQQFEQLGNFARQVVQPQQKKGQGI